MVDDYRMNREPELSCMLPAGRGCDNIYDVLMYACLDSGDQRRKDISQLDELSGRLSRRKPSLSVRHCLSRSEISLIFNEMDTKDS